MHASSLRSACEDRLGRLDLRHRFTEVELIQAVSDEVGRRIVCEPQDMKGSFACGLRQQYDDCEMIFYEQSASPLLRRQIIGHELGHILWDHQGSVSRADFRSDSELAAEIDWSSCLGISARTSYATAEEQEAETLGTIILSRMYRAALTPSTRPAAATERWDAMYT